MRFKHIVILSALLIVVVFSGCATTYNPATGRDEYIFIQSDAEKSIGKKIHESIKQKYKFSMDRAAIQRVKRIGKRLVSVVDRQDLNYKFFVVKSKDVNAFTIPGGNVYVTDSLLKRVARDDELAAVIAHELSHNAARHHAKKMQAQLGYNFFMAAAYSISSKKIRDDWDRISYATSVSFNLIDKGYSRHDELEADTLGLKYMSKAGYDPYAMIDFMEKLQLLEKRERGGWSIFLRSHPYTKERIKNIEKVLAKQFLIEDHG